MKRNLFLLFFVLSAVNTVSIAQTDRVIDTVSRTRIENWKQSPHRLQVGYSAVLNPEVYKILTKVPPLRFTLEYMYDIPWNHNRTNFFVLGGMAYEGGVRDDSPYVATNKVIYEYYDLNRFHLYAGLGFKVRLTHFLSLSASYAAGYGTAENTDATRSTIGLRISFSFPPHGIPMPTGGFFPHV